MGKGCFEWVNTAWLGSNNWEQDIVGQQWKYVHVSAHGVDRIPFKDSTQVLGAGWGCSWSFGVVGACPQIPTGRQYRNMAHCCFSTAVMWLLRRAASPVRLFQVLWNMYIQSLSVQISMWWRRAASPLVCSEHGNYWWLLEGENPNLSNLLEMSSFVSSSWVISVISTLQRRDSIECLHFLAMVF